MARLRGEVVSTEATQDQLPSSTRNGKIEATVEAMRSMGAPEADIEAFLKTQAA